MQLQTPFQGQKVAVLVAERFQGVLHRDSHNHAACRGYGCRPSCTKTGKVAFRTPRVAGCTG